VQLRLTYSPRIRADPVYLQALGQAFYNYTYLEWGVIWTIVKLSADGFSSVPRGKTAMEIARAFTRAIADTQPPLSTNLRRELVKLDEQFRAAIKVRNKLLHAHPYTAADFRQQIGGGGYDWTVERIHDAAKLFEDVAIAGNAIFHGPLAKVRP
jgi:hypothetical protein